MINNIENYVITDGPVGGCCERNKSGSYVGKLEDSGVLSRACDELIRLGNLKPVLRPAVREMLIK